MTKTLVMVMLLAAAPAMAATNYVLQADFNDYNTWDDGWSSSGAVSWANDGGSHGGYVRLGDYSGNSDNKFSTWFKSGNEGTYHLAFDYKFWGWDNTRKGDDTVDVYIDILGPGNQKVYSWTSSSDLTSGWTSTDPPADLYLEEDSWYRLKFYHSEYDGRGGYKVLTEFHLDNVEIFEWKDAPAPSIVPAPSAILMASLGTMLVGAFRRRVKAA